MTIRELNIDEIRQTYKAHLKYDFPSDERKPLAMILNSHKKGNYLCLGAYSGDEQVGYAFFIFCGRICLLDYYAVVRSRRGQGIGTEFLSYLRTSELKSRCDYLLIEVEDPQYMSFCEPECLKARRSRVSIQPKSGLCRCME